MDEKICVNCKHFKNTDYGNGDKCTHEKAPDVHPVAIRQDKQLCGPEGSWYESL